MRRMAVGIATALAVSLAAPAFAEDMTEEIQDEEQPGSEVEVDIGGGKAQVERENGAPLLGIGGGAGAADQLDVPNDPDAPTAGDPVDAELPGEGPEDLSGPEDEDDLPD
jgi:opacity protein-like surface antigen